MAYDRIMKRHARNRGRNRQILSLPQQDWRGVNAVDDIYSMPGHQITPAQNADLGNPVGSITKVAGFESLFPSLGTGQILGLHGWKHPDGDKFIAAWDKYLYLLSGKTGSIAKSSQEDWEAGEGVHTDTESTPGDIKLATSGADFSETATLNADFNGTHSNTVASGDKVILTTDTDPYTVALLHMNATPFTDECGHSVEVTGTVTRSTTYKKLGAASANFSNDGYLALAASSDWHFGSDDFTIDGYVYLANTYYNDRTGIFYCGTSYQEEYWLSYSKNGYLYFKMQNGRTSSYAASISGPVQMPIGEWHHFEVSRSGNTWYLFWDGALVKSVVSSLEMPSPATVFKIGTSEDATYGSVEHTYWHGYVDEFRISKGICRHTENFTPPAIEHVITGYVTSGTYTHPVQDVSGIGATTGLTINYNKTEDTDTAVTIQTRTSTDGGATYGEWTTRASGATLAAAGTDISLLRVQWRAVLNSVNPNYTCSLNDVTIAGNTGIYTSGSWQSPVYDLGNTPFTATLSWTQNTPEGTAVAWFARGSGNGKVFGDWREVAASGSAIPLQRYVQIRIVLTGTLTATPAAQSLLISYSHSYAQANRLDVSPLGRTDNKLTGNRVSFQEYDNRLYCADGLRPFVLYADDSTNATGTAQCLTLNLNPLFSDYTGTIDDDTGDTFTDWTEATGGTGRVEAVSGGISGTSLKITMTDASGSGFTRGVRQYRTLAEMGLVVGDIISIAASYKMSAQIGSTVVVYIQYQDSDGGQVGDAVYVVSGDTAEVTGYARKVTEGLVIPEGTNRIRFTAGIRSTGAYSGQNNQLWVDYFTCSNQNAITLAAGASAVDGFYNNAFITLTGGTGSGQVRFISGYDGTSKIVTVSEPWDTIPDATSTYSIGTAVKARNAGVDPPATACTAAEGGSTGISGTFKYKITFVNRDGYESNPSAASDAVTVTSKNVSLTDIPTGDSTIAERKIYRTKSNGAVFYYVATLEDNTTTTYSDTTADTGLSSLMLDNNNIPVNCSLVYSFLTYMFYVFMDELWFSKATEPESVPAIVGDVQNIICPGLILDIKHNPMALIPMGQDFVAPITTSTGFIFDSDPAVDTTTMRVIANSGSLSAWASDICITPDLRSILAFPSRTGIMALLPGLQEESIESFPLSRNIQTYIDRSVNRESMAGIYHNGRYRVSFQHLGEVGPEWVTFVCDFRQEGREWHGPWTYGASCYAELDGVLYAGDPQVGKIYHMDTGSSFDGEKIRMVADTRMLAPQGENFTYRYNNFMVMVSAESDTTNLIIKPKVDNREASIVPGKLVDTFAGDKRAGHDTIRSRKFRIPLARGSTLSYRIEDDSTNPLSIQKIITEAEVLPLKR